MELELKHLAGYLPYGLYFMYDAEPSEYLMLGLTDKAIKLDEVTESLTPAWVGYNDYFKPILRPLSDLTAGYFSAWFVSEKRFHKQLANGDLPYIIINELYEDHFDVHNLIENGLAININELNK